MLRVFKPIQEELQMIHNKIQKEFMTGAGHLKNFVHLNLSVLNWHLRPALVVLSGKLFGQLSNQLIALAATLQFIYMAARVHFSVKEDRGSDPRSGYQFPVLVGDYLYGKFFTSLCDAGIVHYLKPLSEIICLINRGGILRQINADNIDIDSPIFEEIVRLETAELFSGCCRLGAHLSGASEEHQKRLAAFGLEVGMAYGLMERDAPFERVAEYLKSAYEKLLWLPDRPSRKIMSELTDMFLKEDVAIQRLVV